MSEDVDKILNELKNKQPSAPSSEENADQMLEKIQEERRSKVDNFKLNLDLEEPDGQTGADPASAVMPDSSEPKSRPVPPAGDYAWAEGEKAPSPPTHSSFSPSAAAFRFSAVVPITPAG